MSPVTITHDELEAMLDRAAKRGATQALAAIGLHDENAAIDVREMRSLLEASRDTRTTISISVFAHDSTVRSGTGYS